MKNQTLLLGHQIFALWAVTFIMATFCLSILFANAQAASWELQNPSPTDNLLTSLWGSSDNNLFAVGKNGTIIYYNGNQWTTMNSDTSSDFYAIWGSSGSDVFVVGNDGTILHYDGSQWITMNSQTSVHLIDIWGSSSTDVFAVGNDGTIVHYDGSQWAPMNSETFSKLWGVWGSANNDVFAVGSEGTIIHYDGSQWTSMNSNTFSWLNSIWGSSSQNVFAVGDDNVIIHYDGNQWTAMSSGTYSNLYGVWGKSANEVFAVGSEGTIIHYDGSQWTSMNSNTFSWLWDIRSNSDGSLFAIGEVGTIIHYENDYFGCTDVNATNYNLDATVDDNSCEYNTAPVLNPIGNQSVIQGDILSFTATATDAENDTLEFSFIDAPTEANIDPDTGEFTWTPYSEGNFDLTITVTEAYGTSSTPLSDQEIITISVAAVTPSENTPIIEPTENTEWQEETPVEETEYYDETPEWAYIESDTPQYNETVDEEEIDTTLLTEDADTEIENTSNEEQNLENSENDSLTINVNDTITQSDCADSNAIESSTESKVENSNCDLPTSGGTVFNNIGNPSINLTVNVPASAYGVPAPNYTEMANFNATVDPTASNYTLTITTVGNGSVISDGINCGMDCTEDHKGEANVTLMAIPDTESQFIAWAGHCNGTNPAITMTMNTAVNCVAIFEQEKEVTQSSVSNHTLKLFKVGKGNGNVSSTLNGIDCGVDCDESYLSGTVVTLTATPEMDSQFASWGGDCRGTSSSITVTIRKTVTCTALFDTIPQHKLTISNVGKGTVTASRGIENGINCGSICSDNYYEGSTITLTATPMPDSIFSGWKETDCADSLTMTAPKRCTAIFEKLPSYSLTLATAGEGNGNITNTAGLNCGTNCVSYLGDTQVTLKATPNINSRFIGWEGDCDDTEDSTSFIITEDMSCTANFGLLLADEFGEENDNPTMENRKTEELPTLSEVSAINAQGESVDTDALFAGGISSDDNSFAQSVTQHLSDFVDIRGHIKVDSAHLGQLVDILVVIVVQSPSPVNTDAAPLFFMLDENDNFLSWDGDIANLVAFKTIKASTKPVKVQIYEGQFVAPGGLNIFFGYRSEEGTLIYSPEALELIITD